MMDSQGEHKNQKRKAMVIHNIVASDKKEFNACKNDLMTKLAMDERSASDIASAIREMFLPKLMEEEGVGEADMPEGFLDGDLTDNDEDFSKDTLEVKNESPADEESVEEETQDEDALNDEEEVDDNELATIHITVPTGLIREVEKALETVLGDTDAISKDHAIDHENEDIGEIKDMDKTLEAKESLKKIVLAAMEDDEVQSVSRKEGFEHSKSEQVREEDTYDTFKGSISDPDTKSLDYAENKIPTFKDVITDLGLDESLTFTKFDGTPEDTEEFSLEFNPFEIPSQGNDELYGKMELPSELTLNRKRVVNSSIAELGDFDTGAAEEVLAFALKSAGVEDEDLGKLSYAEALELYKAIRTASDREHYSKDGVMPETPNNPREAVTEKDVREHSGPETDPEEEHERSGRELYSSTDDEYTAMLRKLMKVSEDKEAALEVTTPEGVKVETSKSDKDEEKAMMDKQAELYKARVKTAYSMTGHLVAAGILPAADQDAYAESMLNDNLSTTAMIRQTKLMLNNAAAHNEKLSASKGATRTASAGIAFNPSVRTEADLSMGALEIQNALKNIGWTAPSGMEE